MAPRLRPGRAGMGGQVSVSESDVKFLIERAIINERRRIVMALDKVAADEDDDAARRALLRAAMAIETGGLP